MGARQRAWAARDRVRMFKAMGSLCAACGETRNLTFDCKVPAGADHHAFDMVKRHSYYRQQWQRGNVQLLCHQCNSIKSNWPPLLWFDAVKFAHSSEEITRLACSPGEGTGFTPGYMRECIQCHLMILRAHRDAP